MQCLPWLEKEEKRQGGNTEGRTEISEVHRRQMGPQQKSNQDTEEALKQEQEEARTDLGLQHRVSEMGHRVLLAGHHGHFYH